jgi:hypothetical protein
MSKKVIFFIAAAVVLAGAGIAAYFLFFRNSSADEAPDNSNPTLDPNGQPVNIPGQGSTLITSGATGLANLPAFSGLTEATLASSNVLTSPGSAPAKVHLVVPFNGVCDPFIWYKSWLYSFVESIQDSGTGQRTCYYAVNKSKLPAELLVATPASGACGNFKLYLSGVEYKYVSIRNVKFGPAPGVNYCVYKK